MLKILEEDPMVGGVGGDVQVKYTVILLSHNGMTVDCKSQLTDS